MTAKLFYASVLLFLSALMLQAQEIRINDDATGADQNFPSIAMNANGPTVICWQDARNGDKDIYMQLVNRRGLPFMANIRVDDNADETDQIGPKVAMDKHAQFTVVYMDNIDGAWEVFYRRFYANGVPKGAAAMAADAEHRQVNTSPDIAMSPLGNFVIVWSNKSTDIYAKLFSPDGEALNGDIRVHPSADGFQDYPAVAMHENGSFMVVWVDQKSGVRRIWGRLFQQDGSPVADAFEVSDPADDGNVELFEATIAAGKDGEYFVLWRNGANNRVYGRQIDGEGRFIGSQTPLSEDIFSVVFDISVASHPELDWYQFGWIGMESSGWKVLLNNFFPGHVGTLTAQTVGSGWVQPQNMDLAMANLFNGVYTWADQRRGNYDIYAEWQGLKFPMRTTVGPALNGMIPLSWDPPFGYTQVRPYHIHRINPDGSHVVIATVNPADRALPAQMLDYVDKDVVEGETYQYAVQLDGQPDTQLFFVEATASALKPQLHSQWAAMEPTIDGIFDPQEWMNTPYMPIRLVDNPEADNGVFLFVKNNSRYLYICVVDVNDDLVDPGNSLGIVFDEDHDGRWEPGPSIGEGMITMNNDARLFTAFVGNYPNHLRFSPPQPALNIDFIVHADSLFMVYECRIDLQTGPLNAAPGDTVGFATWIKDPGHFYGWGQSNAGEWPQGALWDAAETLGDLVLATEPQTNLLMLGDRLAVDIKAVDVSGDNREELVVLTKGPAEGDIGFSDANGQVVVFQWNDGAFEPIFSSDPVEGRPAALRIVDVDADGGADILFTCTGLKMLHNAGDSYEMADLITGADLRSFVAIDLNNDGLPDIVAHNVSGDEKKVSLYQQNPDHTFSFIRHLEDSAELNRIVSLNWNGDANPDVLLGSFTSGRLLLLQNNGDLTLTPVYTNTVGPGVTALEAADFDSDGYDDFVVAVNSDNIRVFHNRRNGEFGESYAGSYIGSCYALTAIKIDNDPYPDIVASLRLGNLFLYRNMGAMDFDEVDAGLAASLSPSASVAAGDFDGNGLVDIAFASNPVEVLFDAALRFGVPTTVSGRSESAPKAFQLWQNYPNPFNPTTTIAFDVTKPVHVELKVFDALGREAATLVNQKYEPGRHKATFDAGQFASGLYFYRIRMGDFQQTRKMLLVR